MFCVKKRIVISAIIFFLSFLIVNFSYGDNQNNQNTTEKNEQVYTKEFGIFSGWASGELKIQDDYEAIPLHLQFGFDITSLLSKINIRQQGNLRFLLEPYLNTIVSPNSNVEIGNNFILKYSYPIYKRIYLYFEGGLGMLYTSQHTYEQSTQFNFSEQAGGGISYLFSKNKAISFGYRYRHLSNADIKEPNRGIDMDYFLCGISVLY